MIVYGICGVDGRIRYVGQTSASLSGRAKSHRSNARCRPTTPLAKWMRREINAGRPITFFVIESDAVPHETERRLIAWYRQHGARLLNVTDGGEGTCGFRHSGRKRPDLAARNRANRGKPGRPMSVENKAKLVAAVKGSKRAWLSERNRLAAGKPGRIQTAAERTKRSDSIRQWHQKRREQHAA